MKIKNKANKFSKILSVMFGVSLLVLPIFFTNINKNESNTNIDYNNSQLSQNKTESSLVDDYKFIDEGWASQNTFVWKDTLGDIWSMGRGDWGQTGDGEAENNSLPTRIHDVDGETNVFGIGVTLSEVWAMRDTFVAKDTNGDIWSWGAGGRGQNGDGVYEDNLSPTLIHDVDDGEINVFGQGITIEEAWALERAIIVKDTNGDIWSWGDDSNGELGNDPVLGNSNKPLLINDVDGDTNIFGQGNTIEEAWTMHYTIVVKATNNDIWAWGGGDKGQIGDGIRANRYSPVKVHDFDEAVGSGNVFGQNSTIEEAWTMEDTIIAKDTNDDIWSWGHGNAGQTGDGGTRYKTTPGKMTQFNSENTIVDAWATLDNIIAKDENDLIWAWGGGFNGENGDGMPAQDNLWPARIVQFGEELTIQEAWTSHYTITAKDTNGDIWSWGNGFHGQVGNGNSTPVNHTPWRIPFFIQESIRIVNVWAMEHTFLAIDENGAVWSWGRGDRYGQTGDGEFQNNASPTKILSPGELSIEENSETSIKVSMEGFTNGTSVINQATKATLTYGVSGGTSQTIDDTNLDDGVSFELNNLEIGEIYDISVQYYKDATTVGQPIEKTFANGFNLGKVVVINKSTTRATVIAEGFGNGTGDQEANKATLTYGVSGGTSQTMDDNNLDDGVSFNLTHLNPSTTYDLSITYHKDNAIVGTPIIGTLVTNDVQFRKGTVIPSNISSSTAEVFVSEFQNGTGAQEATSATLTYGISGQQSKTMDDEDLSDGVSFKLTDLETGTYDLSIQYYKDSVIFDTPITSSFTTSPDSESLTQGNLVVSNITGTTATVSVNGFTNGTGANLATKATLTYDAPGTRATIDDTNLNDGVSFDLTGLNQGQDYNLSITYFNNLGYQIGAPIISETPLVPQNPPKSGLSTGAIIGIAVGVGGAALIGGGVGGFFLYKKKKGF